MRIYYTDGISVLNWEKKFCKYFVNSCEAYTVRPVLINERLQTCSNFILHGHLPFLFNSKYIYFLRAMKRYYFRFDYRDSVEYCRHVY